MSTGDPHNFLFISHHGGVFQDPHLQEILDLDQDRDQVVKDYTPDQDHLDHTGLGHQEENLAENRLEEGITLDREADLQDLIDTDQGRRIAENPDLMQEEVHHPEVHGRANHCSPRAKIFLQGGLLKEEIVEVSADQGQGPETHHPIGSRRR